MFNLSKRGASRGGARGLGVQVESLENRSLFSVVVGTAREVPQDGPAGAIQVGLAPDPEQFSPPTATIVGLPTEPVIFGIRHFQVVFSEPVTGFDSSDIYINYYGSTSADVFTVSTADETTFDVSWSTNLTAWGHGTNTVGVYNSDKSGIMSLHGLAVFNAPSANFEVMKPAGSISGYIFNDVDEDRFWSRDEKGLSGWTVYLDDNRNGKLDKGERSTITDENGDWGLFDLPLEQTYRVARVPQAGWRKSLAMESYDFTLSAENPYASDIFWVYTQSGRVTGSVTKDDNGDGKPDLVKWGYNFKVYADDNDNGTLDVGERSVYSSAYGKYELKGLAPGDHVIRVEAQPGWRASSSAGSAQNVSIAPSGTKANLNFVFTQCAQIGGTLFLDADGDTLQGPAEKGLNKWRVFIDKNGNGILDKGERSVLTDTSGKWAFKGLAGDASYAIRVSRPKSTKAVATPAGGTFTPGLGELVNVAWSRMSA